LKLRKEATYSGRFGAQRMRVRIRRPRKAGYYTGPFAFAGTDLIRKSVDPNPLLLLVANGRLGFVTPGAFLPCLG
jgi:hypothetical protein